MKYRHLGSSGLVVSRVCLGTMTFANDDWGCDQSTSNAIVDAFVDAGGNFIDTADMYSAGASEEFLGKALKHHARDDLVIATKCYFRQRPTPNAKGLSRKHIMQSLEASLRRMDLDYVDLYQLHGPDPFTPIEETMRTLDDLVRRGLVRYIGCSNFFAWQLMKANLTARSMGLETFCSGQYMYNLIRRDVEREILPACADQGMGMLCWSPLASGVLTGKYADPSKPEEGTRIALRAKIDVPRYCNESTMKIINGVGVMTKETGRTHARIALSWLLHDPRVASVVMGGTKVDQVKDNLLVGEDELTDEQYNRLSNVAPFDEGYPREWMELTQPMTFTDSEFPSRNVH